MIALCRDHHPEADAGAFAIEQLREFKRTGRERNQVVGARFNWMREKLLLRVGGMFYYEVPTAVQIQERPVVWFTRDASDLVLVNLSMPMTTGESRLQMRDNFWITEGVNIRVINCPPSGRVLSATYQNGDLLRVEFRQIDSIQELDRRYPVKVPKRVKERLSADGISVDERSHADSADSAGVTFPIAVCEIAMRLTGATLRFDANKTTVGTNVFIGGWISHGAVGMSIG